MNLEREPELGSALPLARRYESCSHFILGSRFGLRVVHHPYLILMPSISFSSVLSVRDQPFPSHSYVCILNYTNRLPPCFCFAVLLLSTIHLFLSSIISLLPSSLFTFSIFFFFYTLLMCLTYINMLILEGRG